ncbi:hypothetical protein AC249_AIPGENE13046 [Exaiptasia diaphana]|nr:hypothetical protein AC249_AIPGENE13046 [Exaiptasia diaphana]
MPIIPGIIPNGFSNLSSNTTDLPGAVVVQSSGMLNDNMNPSVKQFLALFDTSNDNKVNSDNSDNSNPDNSQRKPQSIQSQWNSQAFNKKQNLSDRRTASHFQSKENGKILTKDKHVLKARENLKQPESNKRKVTGRLA